MSQTDNLIKKEELENDIRTLTEIQKNLEIQMEHLKKQLYQKQDIIREKKAQLCLLVTDDQYDKTNYDTESEEEDSSGSESDYEKN